MAGVRAPSYPQEQFWRRKNAYLHEKTNHVVEYRREIMDIGNKERDITLSRNAAVVIISLIPTTPWV